MKCPLTSLVFVLLVFNYASSSTLCAKDFLVASAYFQVSAETMIEIFMATGHIAWVSFSPFQSPKCVFRNSNQSKHGSHQGLANINEQRNANQTQWSIIDPTMTVVEMTTIAHRSECAPFKDSLLSQQQIITFLIYDGNETMCIVNASRIPPRSTPLLDLIGVSLVRNPLLLRN
jgi:hypothetical protein